MKHWLGERRSTVILVVAIALIVLGAACVIFGDPVLGAALMFLGVFADWIWRR